MRYKHFKNADADISALTVGTWGLQEQISAVSDMGRCRYRRIDCCHSSWMIDTS